MKFVFILKSIIVNIEKLKVYKVISYENSVKILLITIENYIILGLFVLLVLESLYLVLNATIFRDFKQHEQAYYHRYLHIASLLIVIDIFYILQQVFTCGVCEEICENLDAVAAHLCLKGFGQIRVDENNYFYPVCGKINE